MARLVPVRFALLVVVLLAAGTQLAQGASRPPHRSHHAARVTHKAKALRTYGKPVAGQTGSVVQVDRMWVCRGPVNLDSVTVTMTPASIGERRDMDAVHLMPGCTGRIGRLNVTQWAADGLKSTGGVHDLTIGGGSIRCLGKAPGLHQDGMQIMGGERITFKSFLIDCGRSDDRLINSNLFIKQAGQSTAPPSDVVCDGCVLGGWTAHTVSIQGSIRSGVTNSRLCTGRFPKLTLSIGSDAVQPLNSGNIFATCP